MGPANSSGIISGFHPKYTVSAETVNLASFSNVTSASNLLAKLHAISMLLAWFIGACFGTFCARYCKDIFQDRKVFGLDVWFRLHQFAMGMTVVLSIVGMIPIILD